MLDENLIKVCPRCGYHNPYWENFCQGQGCKESLVGIEPVILEQTKHDKLTQQAELTQKNSSKEEQREANASSRKTVRLVRGATLECQDQPGFTFEITDGSVLGCDPDKSSVDLRCLARSEFISSKHASLYLRDDNWYIQDENSTNGTYVNGQPIPKLKLFPINDGDLLTLANTTFKFGVKS